MERERSGIDALIEGTRVTAPVGGTLVLADAPGLTMLHYRLRCCA